MFIKKLRGSIRLYIDYKKLNIRKVFNRIRIATLEDKELLIFCTPIKNFKPKVL